MASTTAVMGMLRTDGLRMRRDRFLTGTVFYIIGISVAMRWALPWIVDEVATRLTFDLTPYVPLIVSHLVIQLAGLLGGIVGGFLLLDGREGRTVKAFLVAPVPLPVYLAVLSLVLCVAAVVLTLFEGAVIGMGLPPWPALVGAGVAGAPAAAGLALLVGAVADTKTEAFAYMKFIGLGPVLASGAYFLSEPWQWLVAVYPPYWASKAYWVAEAGAASWPLWALGGLITSAIWLAVLSRLYLRAARKQ